MKWYLFHICLVNAQETQWKPRVLLMPTAGTPTVFSVESWTELEGAKFATAPELSVYCKIWSTCPCYLYLCLFPCYFHAISTPPKPVFSADPKPPTGEARHHGSWAPTGDAHGSSWAAIEVDWQWFGTVHFGFDGFWAHPTCWTVALPLASSCGPGKLWRQVFQTVSERAGRCASREKMDESQGCHQPDEKCAGLRSSAFFFANKNPTKMAQLLAPWGHAGSRYTPALCDLGVCAQQHVGVFWNKAPTERLLLVFFGHETVSECFMILMRFQNNVLFHKLVL